MLTLLFFRNLLQSNSTHHLQICKTDYNSFFSYTVVFSFRFRLAYVQTNLLIRGKHEIAQPNWAGHAFLPTFGHKRHSMSNLITDIRDEPCTILFYNTVTEAPSLPKKPI